MKTRHALGAIALLIVFSLILEQGSASAATVGKAALDFTLETHDGKKLTLSKLKGKRGVVLVFFATWCPGCMMEVPHVKKLVEASRDKGLLVYGVNVQQPLRIVEKFMKEKAVNYRILLDKDAAVTKKYNVQGIPLILGIDKGGTIRYREHGLPGDTAPLIKQLTQ
ncbi:MAG: peroxiredoxin family protein [Planctomycetota bacterium]|jgi:peroxiredoxin